MDVRRTVMLPEPNGESADMTRGSADSAFGVLVSNGPKNPWRALTRSPGRFTRTLMRFWVQPVRCESAAPRTRAGSSPADRRGFG